MFCCADCCQEPSSSAASLTPVSRLARSRCLTLLFLMVFCGWPKCKHQMAPCRVSYGRLPHLMDSAGRGRACRGDASCWFVGEGQGVAPARGGGQSSTSTSRARPTAGCAPTGRRRQSDQGRPSCRCRGAAVWPGRAPKLRSLVFFCFECACVSQGSQGCSLE